MLPQQLFGLKMHPCTLASRLRGRIFVDPAAVALVVDAGRADIANMATGRDHREQIPQPHDQGVVSALIAVTVMANRDQNSAHRLSGPNLEEPSRR